MRKSLSRVLYLIGLVVVIVGGILEGVSLAGIHVNQTTGAITGAPNSVLLIVAGLLLAVGGILAFVAWIGALVKTAQLGRWGWFVCLIIFSGITMLIYIFGGPETRPVQRQVA
jgi:hypothetical protein